MSAVLGVIVPGLPHPLLRPEGNPSWAKIRAGYDRVRQEIIDSDAEILILYSTQWFSILGHQIQADPAPKWIHVDQDFHELGSMPYEFKMDVDFAKQYEAKGRARNLHIRTISYNGFPIDTGSVVALKLLNPDNRIPACIVSCNMYADRAETIVLGKAAADAIKASGKKAAVVAVTCLSNRLHTHPVADEEDHVSSQMDDEWNQKLLEILAEGRLEDVAQLARTFAAQAHADNKLKAIWWLSAVMGQHNRYRGNVHAYGPIFGAGCTVASIIPSEARAIGHEFDEDDVEVFAGDRDVLGTNVDAPMVKTARRSASQSDSSVLMNADESVSSPQTRRVGDLIYLSGVGPRQATTNTIPGGPIRDQNGGPLNYDIEAQTRAVIDNIRSILEAAGSSLENIVDVTAFLVDMDRDFATYNKVYAEYFSAIQATRTTLSVQALPTSIAVEFKVVALAHDAH